jgi:hypothetical protein
MAINQNHTAEELNGIKAAIVEKNASSQRVEFLKKILEYNGFTVVVAPSPPPKAASPVTPVASETTLPAPGPPIPETFTVGVTDLMFNPINAIFGRLLKAPGGHTVTLAYWQETDIESNDETPYFDLKKSKLRQ